MSKPTVDEQADFMLSFLLLLYGGDPRRTLAAIQVVATPADLQTAVICRVVQRLKHSLRRQNGGRP